MTAPQNHPAAHPAADDPGGISRPDHDTSASTPSVSPPRSSRTRLSELWVTVVAFAVVLLVLLIFVLENDQRSEVSFFGAHGNLPTGVALLLAAVFGVLLVAVPSGARILQLRRLGHRPSHRDATTPPIDNEGRRHP